MLAILAKSGAIKDFWYSYILDNLAYAGSLSLNRAVRHFQHIFLNSPIHQLLLVALLGVGLLVCASRSADILLLFKRKKWACSGLLVYAGAALFAVCRPRFFFLHYAIFLVPPMTYLAAVLTFLPKEVNESDKESSVASPADIRSCPCSVVVRDDRALCGIWSPICTSDQSYSRVVLSTTGLEPEDLQGCP